MEPAGLLGPSSPVTPRLLSGSPDGWQALDRVLAVRLDSLGDVLMTTPALRALKAQHRRRRITLLTSPAAATVGALIPDVDEVITYDAPWMKASAARRSPAADLGLIERLATGRFDAAAIFTVHSQSPLPAALVCQLAGIPRRLAHCRENPYQLLSEWVQEPEPDEPVRHEVRRQLDLVRAVGAIPDEEHLSIRVPPEAARRLRAELTGFGLDLRAPWLLVHPGASAPSRRYPVTLLGRAVAGIASQTGWPIVFAGGPTDGPLVDEVRAVAGVPSRSLAGSLDLAELSALIALAPLFLANNSGPAHLAAALGTPLVELYALTNLQHGQWQVPSRILFRDVPCRACRRSVCPEGHHRCLTAVPPDAVVAACLDLAAELGLERGVAARDAVLLDASR